MISFNLFSSNVTETIFPIDSNQVIHKAPNLFIEFKNDDRNVNDSFYFEDEDLLIVNIGVIYNEYKIHPEFDKGYSLFQFLKKTYYNLGEKFPKILRGSFCGIIYDKRKDQVLTYTDHVSMRRVFWYKSEDTVIISSDLIELSNLLKKNGKNPKLCTEAAYMMCSYGYMLHDLTLIENTKKLLGGNTLNVSLINRKHKISSFFDVNSIEVKDNSFDNCLAIMEETYSDAISKEFERDKKSNTKHLITLSGGLDSRAVRFVAKDLGYNEVLNITMSQSGYADEEIAKKIASKLMDDFLFVSLDNGKYLTNDIGTSVKNNGATIQYFGNAHMDKMIDSVNLESYGLLHTAVVGGAVMGGTYSSWSSNKDIKSGVGAYSKKLVNYLSGYLEQISTDYINTETFMLINRGFNGTFNGIYSSQRKIEGVAASVQPEVLEANLSFPVKNRRDAKLYIDWMIKYHPEMTNYIWEKTSLKPGSNRYIEKIVKYYKAINRRVNKNDIHSMNPYEYWYEKNVYFRERIELEINYANSILSRYKFIVKDFEVIWKSGNVQEKMQYISLAYSAKLLNLLD